MSNTVLLKAIELTEKYGWNKHDYALDKGGNYANTYSEEACSFCALGFIGRARHELGMDDGSRLAEQLVEDALPEGYGNIAQYNDAFGVSKQDIIELFRKANESSVP